MAKVIDPQTDKDIHAGRREKLRQAFLKSGLESFNETQVLEYALGLAIPRIDTNPIAHRLIAKFGSLAGVVDAHPARLSEVAGVGQNCAIFLNFLKQFVTFYASNKQQTVKIRSSQEAIEYLRPIMKTYTTEQFVLLVLDKTDSVILRDTTTSGDLDKVDLNLRQIVDLVLRVKAVSVVISHNHLGDNATPSDADMRLTRYLVNIFTPLSIRVVDHVIFAGDKYFSFETNKLISIFKREQIAFFNNEDYGDYLELGEDSVH